MALDFLILYEHIVREYESILLLQEELRRRGYSCEIRQLLDRKKLKYFTWKKPKVLVASNMYDNEGLNSHVYNNVGRLNKVVNLHWEQMLSATQEEEPWFNFSGNAKLCVQTCWGEATKKRLQAHGVADENAPVTGAVMMDFLRPEFSGYYDDKEALCRRHGLDPARPLWLYISSFGYASMDEAEVKELSDMAGTDFTEFARVNRESMAETLDWFDRLLEERPDVQVVYRRHPSEWNSPALEALAAKRPGFRVIFEGSVKQWIVAADTAAIWMSTAIAEVYFAAKAAIHPPQCLILRPQPIPEEFDPVIYKDASYITSYEELVEAGFAPVVKAENDAPKAVSDTTANTENFPIVPAVIEAYFDSAEKPAYVRMADLLEDVYKNPPCGRPFGPGFTPHFNWLKFFALVGVHMFHALRFNPIRLKRFAPGFAAYASRIYGYIDKAHITKAEVAAMREKIRRFLP